MPRFSPKPDDTVSLFGASYTFQEHPGAPGMVFAADGGRGSVYQVKSADDSRSGLKVFRKQFRVERLLQSSRNLDRLRHYRGLLAAHRRVVPPTDPATKTVPELEYAVLMPWVPGKTWYDCLGQAESTGTIFNVQIAKMLTANFLEILAVLERESIAHTDISAGNVVFNNVNSEAQLLDLEDIYIPGAPRPNEETIGTLHYQHRGQQPTWRPEGDRYAAGVLASEILLMAHEPTAQKATTNGYYMGNCTSPLARQRFEEASDWLKFVAPQFHDTFSRTWWSDSLKDCPSIEELCRAFLKEPPLKIVTPSVPWVWEPLNSRRTYPIGQPPGPEKVPLPANVSLQGFPHPNGRTVNHNQIPSAMWGNWGTKAEATIPPQVSASPSTWGAWGSQHTSPRSLTDDTSKGSRAGIWLLVIAVILVLLYFASSR